MEENNKEFVIKKEALQNMSLEDLVDLKIELDDMLREVDELIAKCDELLKKGGANT